MKQQTTFFQIKLARILSCLILLLLCSSTFYGQTKEYATSQDNWKSGTGLLAAVNHPERSVDNDENTNAELESRLINVLGIQTSGESWIQMNFSTQVPVNSTTYVKVDAPTTTGGLNLDLLATLGGLLGILESDLLDIGVYNDSLPLNSSDFSTTIVEDLNGQSYIAVTSTKVYTGVRVKLKYVGNLLGLSLGSGIKLNIYEAFYYTDAPDCGRPLYTYYEDSGLSIGLLEFQNRNLNRAIDGDENTFSQLKQGALLGVSVAGSQSQVFEFGSPSTETATINIKLLLGSGGVLNTDLLGASEVILYNGAEKVYQRSLQSSLLNNTELLGLLQNGEPITMAFAPGRAFDRAEVRLTSPVGVALLSDALKIYDVQRYDGTSTCLNPKIKPTPTATTGPFQTASCAGALVDFDNVDFAFQAVDGNNETFATLYADSGSLLVSGPTAGFVEMNLGETVPANKTTYVRINYDEDVLQKLVQGSLGKLVTDLANNLLLGNQYFEVEAKMDDIPVLNEDSSNAFEGNANGVVALVQDYKGRYYIAITPNAEYNSIRITNHVTAVLPTGKKASLDVYDACFEKGTDSCFPANFTSYRGGGIGLDAANITSVGVENPYRAISDNSSEYSTISLGVAGVAANVYQTIYFSHPSEADDYVKMRVQIEPSSTLSVDLLGAYKVKFFNGKTQVGGDYTLQGGSLINNLDLLALFKSGGIVNLEFTPTGTFDRVEIGAESLVALNVAAQPLRVYSVKRFGVNCPETIGESPFDLPVCATRLLSSENADDVNNLFNDDFDSFATINSGIQGLLGLGGNLEGHIELGYDTEVPAGTTSYIRFDYDEDILNGLLGGSLGNVVTGLLNGLLLGDHFFEVDVKHNGTSIAKANSKDASEGGNAAIRVVRDKEGRYYIAVTPDAPYTSIRITDKTEALLAVGSPANTLNVYGMCYETSTDCEKAFMATSYEYTGLSLTLNDVSGAGVANPQYALNDTSTQYSEISMGTLNIAGGAKQWIFLNRELSATDAISIKFKVGTGAVDLALLGDLKIQAYLGNTPVDTLNWGTNGIVNGINVLDLINNGGVVDLPYQPGASFDRISVGIENLVSASVFPPVELHGVDLCANLGTPEFVSWKSANQTSVKGGEEIEYTIHVNNIGAIDIHGVVIKDILPAYTTYVSGGTNNNGVVVFPELDVEVGETKTVTFKVKVDNDLTGVTEIVNIATVNGVETFPSLSNNPNEPDTSVTPSPGTKVLVEQVKSVVSWKAYEVDGDKTKTAVSGGEEVKYHIYVRNTGNQDLTNVTISDVLPAGLTWVTGGTHSGGAVTFTIPTLAVGATSSALNFTARVNKDLTGIIEIKNIAVVKTESTDSGTESFPPVDNANPTEPDTTTPGTVLDVTPIHDVEISKVGESNNTTSSAQAQVGDIVTYTITVKNVGNKALSNLTVEDVIPTNLTITSPTGSTVSGNTFTDVISTLDVDDEVTFTIVGTVDNLNNLVSNNIENTATVTYRNEDNTADKTESATHKMSTSCTPVLADKITLTPASLTVCAGETFTITATNSVSGLTNPVYKWYTNANLTGAFFEGATLDLTNGLMTTTTYYVILEADGYCFTTPAATVTVTVNARPVTPIITVGDTGTTVCEGVAVSLKSSVVEGNTWYKDGSLIVGADKQELIVYEAGVYTVVVTDENLACPSLMSDEVTIVMNTAPTLDVPGEQTYSIAVGESVQLPTATSPNGGTIKWYTGSGVEITNMQLTFETPGVFYYSVVATLGDCSVSSWIQVIVSDLSACGMPDERVYATMQSYTGSGGILTGGENAISEDPYTYSTLTSAVGAIGLGLAGQRLQWDHTIQAGTPVTIKLGTEYSGLALAGAISVVGTKRNSFGNAMDVGVLKPVDGSLLNLVGGKNSFEYTFVPVNTLGKPRDYDGVKILVGGLLSVAQNANVYGAYYKELNTATEYDCSLSEVRDIYYGTYAPVINALGATTGVSNEWLAVDGNPATFALMYLGAAVANQTYMNVEFRTPFRKNDILKITMSKDIGLSVDLLTGLVIRRYLGNHQVGPDITQFNFLNLIGADPTVQVITPVLDSYEPFDRVEIFKAGVADVLSFIRIHEIERIVSPESIIDNVEFVDNKGFVIKEAICKGGTIDLNTNADDGCTTYLWYDEDNEVIGIGNSLRIPNTYGVGEHKVYLQPVRYGCENLNRTEVIFTIIQCSKDCIISNPMLTNKIKR